MANIAKNFVSDAPLQNVNCTLEKAGGAYYGHVELVFDGGRKTVRKTVNLADLTEAQRDAGLLFYNALHAAGLLQVTGDDF